MKTFDPDSGVKYGLATRHLSMLALAGIIGPGLLVGAGGALNSGGPASLIIGFGVVGLISLPVMFAVGELSTNYPTGGFISLAARFVDPAFAAALGLIYWLAFVCVCSNELNVIMSIMTFWSDKVPAWGYFLLFWFAFVAFQLLGVTAFGEAEFWLALFKLVGLAAYFIFSLIYACGGVKGRDAVAFRYWHDPFNNNGFRGVASVFVFCATFYAGVESVAMASSETKNPHKGIPKAINQVFIRIIFVYMGSAFFFGLTTPANAKGLVNAGEQALQSPMTIAIQNAGFEGGVHLINAFILVTTLSAVNSSIYISSRTIFFMAQEKLLPKIFRYTDKRGVMIPAILVSALFGCISLMNLSTGAGKAYQYIINLSGVSTFITWACLCFIHIRFRHAWEKQGRSVEDLPYKSKGYPYLAYFGLLASIFLTLVQGWTNLSPFDAGGFVDAYVLIPAFFIIIAVYKLVLKTRWAKIDEIDLDVGKRGDIDSIDSEESSLVTNISCKNNAAYDTRTA